jgi:hypothetical protein
MIISATATMALGGDRARRAEPATAGGHGDLSPVQAFPLGAGGQARAARAAPQHPVAGSDATRSYAVTVSPRDVAERGVADRRQRG